MRWTWNMDVLSAKVAMGVREGNNGHSGLWCALVVKAALPTMLLVQFCGETGCQSLLLLLLVF